MTDPPRPGAEHLSDSHLNGRARPADSHTLSPDNHRSPTVFKTLPEYAEKSAGIEEILATETPDPDELQ
jgi:hypothetical protein